MSGADRSSTSDLSGTMVSMDAEELRRVRARGREIVLDLLGVEPDVSALIDAADGCLGVERSRRCVDLVRDMALSQRHRGLSAMAALVMGTRELGVGWWSRPREDPIRSRPRQPAAVTPDQRLAAHSVDSRDWSSPVVELGWWIADDVAEAQWGPLVDEVDLNDPRGVDRVRHIPADAVPGQRVTVSFDPGSVIDAVVEVRDEGVLGTRLVDDVRFSAPAELDWAWAVSIAPPGPFPLAGDSPMTYGAAVDPQEADRLRGEASSWGWPQYDLGPPWRTRADLCAALARLGWPWLNGLARSHEWEKAARRLLDGDGFEAT